MFEEHGIGRTCAYFELHGEDAHLNEELGPRHTVGSETNRPRATTGQPGLARSKANSCSTAPPA